MEKAAPAPCPNCWHGLIWVSPDNKVTKVPFAGCKAIVECLRCK